MDLSENQFTARMSGGSLHETEPFVPRDRVDIDQRLLEQEMPSDKPDPVEASLTDLDEYLHTLPFKEHEAALEGIREYQKACLDIDMGWHKYL